MKTKTFILFLFVLIQFQPCIAQETATILPKVENYTKGELDLKITSFGEKNPITVGKIMADGSIHLNWPEIDLNKFKAFNYWTKSIESYYGGKFCRNSNPVVSNENAILIEIKYIYLFKYGQPVGCIIPTTQQNKEHYKDLLGSTIDWVYSDSDTSVKANCSENIAWEDLYNFDQTIAYNIKFKKGFNLVSNSLTAIEEWDTEKEKGNMPKTRSIQSVDQIPANIHWQLKYWANDELLEIEQKLNKLKPITKQQYENWLPKKLGNLIRTGYEIGKTIERMPTLNNVNLLFEKGSKKIDLTIVDCVGSKVAADAYTIIMDMASRDWKDKTETGYRSAADMDDNRVLTEYIEKETKTTLNYNANARFLIKAEGNNIKPEELWDLLKDLNLYQLTKK